MTELSPKVKPKRAEKWSEKLAPVLGPGELVWAFVTASRFKPMSEGTAITNTRVVGFVTYGKPDKQVIYEVSAADIASFELTGKKGGMPQLVVTTPEGEVNFGGFDSEEEAFIRHYLTYLQRQGSHPAGSAPVVRTMQAPAMPSSFAVPTAPDPTPAADSSHVGSVPAGAQPPAETGTGSGIADEIERLAGLYERGLLDADEFRAAKQIALAHLARANRSVSLQKGS
ncbi:hypothetical protein ABLE94_12860 [Gordonia sp. VNK1]|uniref:hypothetical protein n=1 Tax=Gordonia oleivorans TaxID=3156618 RepID=UPI0032B477E3